MPSVHDVLQRYRLPAEGPQNAGPFRVASAVSPAATAQEIASSWPGRALPADASQLWLAARSSRLFEDIDYGQWGLVLLDPQASRERTDTELSARPADFRRDDVVVGEFLGDQELLVLAPSENATRRVLIALPLDPRDDWYGAAKELSEFLGRYFDASGSKFWERRPNEM